ncbi:MAG: metal ABC transporter substrate-binding protein [Deltaproteobacteria bacterium]|nr:metal ABC transporter substrate-binding protein [Deltaproteobacteria bacterium]
MALGLSLTLPRNLLAADKIPVVASIVPLGDFCTKIGGERVEVTVLIPPGASPHIFEPTPQAVSQAFNAKVFVYVGAGLDPWAAKVIAAKEAKSQQVVEAVAGLRLEADTHIHHHGGTEEAAAAGDHAAEGSKNHDHSQLKGNPHVWLDPVWAQDICRRIAGTLTRADPAHRQVYEDNLDRYLRQLADLHQEIARRTAAWRLKEYVSFHPSFVYFAKRYGLREAGVIEAAPGREPTPGHIRKIVKAIQKFGVRVVFAEPQLNPRMAEIIAREAGAKVLLLDPLGGRPPYGNDYIAMMRYNLEAMEQAMK